MSRSSDQATKSWRKRATITFIAVTLVFVSLFAGTFWNESDLVFRSISWQWTGWHSMRFEVYDPCRTPDGRPSAATVYHAGPITFVKFAWRKPAGLPLPEVSPVTELDVKEPASSNANGDLFPLLPASKN